MNEEKVRLYYSSILRSLELLSCRRPRRFVDLFLRLYPATAHMRARRGHKRDHFGAPSEPLTWVGGGLTTKLGTNDAHRDVLFQ